MKDDLLQLIAFFAVLGLLMSYLVPGCIQSLVGEYYFTGLFALTFRLSWANHSLDADDIGPIAGFAWFWPIWLFIIPQHNELSEA